MHTFENGIVEKAYARYTRLNKVMCVFSITETLILKEDVAYKFCLCPVSFYIYN